MLLAPSFYLCRWSTAFNIILLFLEETVSGSGTIAFRDKKVSQSMYFNITKMFATLKMFLYGMELTSSRYKHVLARCISFSLKAAAGTS